MHQYTISKMTVIPDPEFMELVGGAVVLYHQHKEIKKWILPITTRSHINTMKLLQFERVFQIIISRNKSGDHIISDSQNCIKLLNQTNYTNDDAMMVILNRMSKQWEKTEFDQYTI